MAEALSSKGVTDPPAAVGASHVWAPYHASQTPFLFEQRQGRLSGAFGASAAAHVGIFLLAVFVARALPESAKAPFLRDLTNYNIVWLPAPGPGGGGGGGGNKSPEPPRKAELPGKDKATVPVVKPPKLENPEPPKEPPPEQKMTIPAKTLSSAEIAQPGVLEGMSASASTSSQGSGTEGGAGTGRGTGIGPGEGSGLGPGSGGNTGGGVYRPGSGIENPRLIRDVKPQYTADAMRAKIQGTVWLEAIVLPDGSVGRVEIIKSLDPVFGLDQEAVKAAKMWRFAPGTRFGQPVAVVVTIELTFTLR